MVEGSMRSYIPFLIVSIAFFILLCYQHEVVHQEILRFYGIDSDIRFDFKAIGFVTIPTNRTLVTSDELREIRFLNLLNEIFFYHFLIVFTFLIIIGLVIIRRTEW
jgi:hypothetical protein